MRGVLYLLFHNVFRGVTRLHVAQQVDAGGQGVAGREHDAERTAVEVEHLGQTLGREDFADGLGRFGRGEETAYAEGRQFVDLLDDAAVGGAQGVVAGGAVDAVAPVVGCLEAVDLLGSSV